MEKMKIRPIGNRILVKVVKIEEKIVGGIILPGSENKEKSNIAQVVAIGEMEKNIDINVGDKIMYSKFSGTEIKDGDNSYLIVDTEDILAIVE